MRKILIIVVVLILLTPLWMYLFWAITPSKELRVLILDKTVLDDKTQEHISLSWVLTNRKYVKSDGSLYDRHVDYYGFFPGEAFDYEIRDFNHLDSLGIDSLADYYDMAYYTDLYGIYRLEWYGEDYEYKEVDGIVDREHARERSPKVYGGMTQKEVDFLKRMKERNKLIIAEFNTFASPTPYHIRRQFEKEFDLRWSNWIGRYFIDLDTTDNEELPNWLVNNYLLQNDSVWPYTKSGIAFVRNDDFIIILEDETHLNYDVPIIVTDSEYRSKYNLPAKIEYPFWFDITYATGRSKVVSNFEVDVNPTGRRILQRYNISPVFPAVIKNTENDFLFYYFCGDFCDNPITMRTAKFRAVNIFSNFFVNYEKEERVSFFWWYYRPMLKTIIDSYYSDMQ